MVGVCVKRGEKSEIKMEVLGGLVSVPKKREQKQAGEKAES